MSTVATDALLEEIQELIRERERDGQCQRHVNAADARQPGEVQRRRHQRQDHGAAGTHSPHLLRRDDAVRRSYLGY